MFKQSLSPREERRGPNVGARLSFSLEPANFWKTEIKDQVN
jgi:hypothetical protein